MHPIELISEITCPECGHIEREMMPTNCCLYYYECRGCNVLLKPQSGDCCVFCSYGTVSCPPKQKVDNLTNQGECCK